VVLTIRRREILIGQFVNGGLSCGVFKWVQIVKERGTFEYGIIQLFDENIHEISLRSGSRI
jgi:hypothetical protein